MTKVVSAVAKTATVACDVAARGGSALRPIAAVAMAVAGVFQLAGAALAQQPPGDAAFCNEYADTAATAAGDAIALNPNCIDYNSGVHDNRKMHYDWCLRNPRDSAEGAALHIRQLASRCTRGVIAMPNDYGGYDIAGNRSFERPYASVRQWDVKVAVTGRTFMYCVAETGGPDHPVRIGFDRVMPGGSGQWQLAVPVQAGKDWQGQLEVDGAAPAAGAGAMVSGTATDGWAIAWLNMGQVDALRNGSTAVLGVGRGDYDFSLKGIAAAITKIDECRDRRGAGATAAPAAQKTGQAPAAAPAAQTAAADPAVVNAPVIFGLKSKPNLCVRTVGGNGPGSGELALASCDGAAESIFLLEDRGGPVRLSAHTDSCATVNRAQPQPQPLTTTACRNAPDRWRYDEKSGQVQNGEGLCWSVKRPVAPGARILGAPCRPKDLAQKFDRRI